MIRIGLPERLTRREDWLLTRHFFRALFDFGILTTAGADSFTHLLLGGAGAFLSMGFLAAYLYAGKYAMLRSAGPELLTRAVLGDELMLVGAPMLLAALVTVLVSASLFPDERDFRILGPLPVTRTVIFRAKLAAVVLFSGLFIVVIHAALLPLMLLTSLSSIGQQALWLRLASWMLAGASGSLFGILSVAAIVGLFELVGTRFTNVQAITQPLLIAALVLGAPFALRLSNHGDALLAGARWMRVIPPAWFVGIEHVLGGTSNGFFQLLAGMGIVAFLSVTAVVACCYVALFRHFERLRLSPLARPSRDRRQMSPRPGFGSHDPAFLAVRDFMTLSLRRSRLHQGALLGILASGVALVSGRFLAELSLYGTVQAAFTLIFVSGLAVRTTLSLPLEQRANWIFRMTERDRGRIEQLRAVDRLTTIYMAGLPAVATLLICWNTFGARAASVSATMVVLAGWLAVHAVLSDWRRIPFTCSYMPGKRFVATGLLVGLAGYVGFTAMGMLLVRLSISNAVRMTMIVAVLSVTAWWLRRRRLHMWRGVPLIFDEELPNRPLQLGL